MHRNRISGGWLLAALLLAGCASIKSHLPFGKARAPAPEPVSELALASPAGGASAVLQFWERNTLVLDLQNVPVAGQVVLSRHNGRSWPARIAVRMAAQRFEVVEVRGAQRMVLPVTASGSGAVTAQLPPGILDSGTAALTISWGARGDF
jgi:hypothetical protein